jgi:hypothetical protein
MDGCGNAADDGRREGIEVGNSRLGVSLTDPGDSTGRVLTCPVEPAFP